MDAIEFLHLDDVRETLEATEDPEEADKGSVVENRLDSIESPLELELMEEAEEVGRSGIGGNLLDEEEVNDRWVAFPKLSPFSTPTPTPRPAFSSDFFLFTFIIAKL